MIHTNATLSAKVRKEKRDGRDFLVAPAVMLVEGVVNGEFVAADEFKPTAWDGVPVVLDHPDENGEPISARDPDVLEDREVGRVFAVQADGDKLKGEAWIDVEQVKRRGCEGERLLKLLQGGTLIEVSTAYRRTFDETPGTHAGEQYRGTVHDIEPDHFAILLDATGACSVEDGCGLPRVNQQEVDMVQFNLFGLVYNILSEARRPTFEGTTEAEWSAPTLEQFINAFPGDKPESNRVEDLPGDVKAWIAGHTLLGDAGADNLRDLVFFPVVDTAGRLSRGALMAVIGGRGAQADIPQAAKDSAQSMARGLLEREFEMEEQENRMKQLQGKASETVANALRRLVKALGHKDILIQEDSMTKEELIEALVKNGGTGLSREQLEPIAEDALRTLADNVLDQEDPQDNPSPCPDNPETPAPPETPDPPEATIDNAEVPAQFKAFWDGIQERGGPDAFFAQVDAVQANEEAERAALATELKANKDHSFPPAMVDGMTVEQLRALRRTVSPTLFAPADVQVNADGTGEIVALERKNPWVRESTKQEVQ